MRGILWSPDAPEGVAASLRARKLEFLPQAAGPFAINLVRRPRAEGVELSFEALGAGETARTSIQAERGQISGADTWELEGGAVARGPDGRVLRARSFAWIEGSAFLRALAPIPDPEEHGSARAAALLTDLWLNPTSTTDSQGASR